MTLKNSGLPLLALLMPFLILYWLVPAFSDLTIGADYTHYPIEAQMEVNQSIEHGAFPLYAPGFAGGQSAAAMTLGQASHPITHIARVMPGYWDGSALSVNTMLRLVSIGMVTLLFFCTLRNLGVGGLVALLLSVYAVFNLRMLDHFRYGASLENHTAFLALGCFVLLTFLRPRSLVVGVGVVASSYLLMAGGHPQVTYLGYLAAGFLALFTPFFIASLPNKNYVVPAISALLKQWVWLFLLVTLGALCAAPYAIPFYFEFLSSASMRTENPYDWSLAYQDSIGGILRSFYAPLSADVMSAFGGSVLSLWVLMLIPFFAIILKAPKVIWFLFAFLVVSLLITMGNATPLHYWVWKFFPLADSFRVPGRYSLWLIFPFLLLAVWLVARLPDTAKLTTITKAALVGMPLAVFVIMNVFADSYLSVSNVFVPEKINDISNSVHNYWFYLGVLNLVLAGAWIVCISKAHSARNMVLACLAVGIFSQTALSMRYGTWVEENKVMPTLSQLDRNKYDEFVTEATPGFGLSQQSVVEQLDRSFIEPRLATLYRDVRSFSVKEAVWAFLGRERDFGQAAVFADQNIRVTPEQGIAGKDKINLVKASFNELIFDVNAHQQVLFATNIPFNDRWEVAVNGQTAQALEVNGNNLGAMIPAGAHSVQLRYVSQSMQVGLWLSLASFCFCVALFWFRSESKHRNVLATGILAIGLGIYYIWMQSFYGTGYIPTAYSWQTPDQQARKNLAYGRTVAASSMASPQMPYLYSPSQAIDGDWQSRGYRSEAKGAPSWKVDLGNTYLLDEIVIYGEGQESFPISIWVSDGHSGGFNQVAQIASYRPKIRISLEGKGVKSQYLVVAGPSGRILALKEVEVFGSAVRPVQEHKEP